MGKIKLDMKDRRILDVLDKDANISISKLAKKVGISRQVAEYRLNKLTSQKTIYAFYTLISFERLGYTNFRVHIRLKNVDEKNYTNFAKQLFTKYPAFWVAFISGTFDIVLDILAKNANEFEKILEQIIKENSNIIQNYDTMVVLAMDLYPYSYFIGDKKERQKKSMYANMKEVKLDEKDKKILQIIKLNSRMSYETIGRKVGLTRNSVKNRIKNLEKNKVISGYKIFIDFNHFNKESFKVFLKYDNSKIKQEKELLEYLKNHRGILATLKFLGRWNMDIEIHAENTKKLQQFIINLRNKFDIIENYEIAQIIEDYGIDFLPNKLT